MTAFAPNGRLHVVVTGDFDDAQLREALRAHDGIDVLGRSADIRAAAPALGSVELDAVLHGTSGAAGAEALHQEVVTIRRYTTAPIVLLAPAADPQLADTALAAGVEDVLVLPQMAETIAFAIRKAKAGSRRHASVRAEISGGGEVITVFSPKGGTGKTVLSTNLASLIASQGEERVLLIDLDLQFGDAAIMLGLDPERTLASLVLDPGELDAEKLTGFTMRHRSGLDVLAAPLRPEEAELVSEVKVLKLLEVARQAYDVVVVDTSPFFYGPMLALLEPTDHLLLLCGLDVPTLKNVRLSLRTLELLGFPRERTSLVLNRVAPKVGITREDVEQALGMSVSFEIPNDPVVAQAVNRGTPAALLDGESVFADAVKSVVGALRGKVDKSAVADSPAARFRWLGGTRRRLLEGRA